MYISSLLYARVCVWERGREKEERDWNLIYNQGYAIVVKILCYLCIPEQEGIKI